MSSDVWANQFLIQFSPRPVGMRINFALACRLLDKDGFDGEKIYVSADCNLDF